MASKSSLVIRNGAAGVASQVVVLLLSFLSRSLFLKYIGEEMLGINSTFASILDALSLGELGFQSAVVFMLYKPLQEEDKDKVNEIITLLKTLYRYVGIFFIVAAIVVLPLLKFVLKGVTVTPQIQIYFLMQTSVSAVSYFLAYPRSLLYADQKEYVSKLVDLVVSTVTSVLSIISLIYLRSYGVYLLLKIANVFISNIVVLRRYKKAYPYIHKVAPNKSLLREIWNSTKNIFVGRLAGFLYRSTANLVISSFISTVTVAFYGNYLTVLTSLRTLVESAMTSMIPIIGNSLASAETVKEKESLFNLYSYVRYLIALVVVIPFILLIDLFIELWLGAEYIMPWIIKCMMAADLYIHLVHTPTYDFITAAGMFREARNIELLGAVLNIIVSVTCVNLIGLYGVLAGTIVSQVVFWIGRSYLVFRKYLKYGNREYMRYWAKEGAYALVFLVCLGICYFAVNGVAMGGLLGFLVGGIICEMIVAVFILVVLRRVPESRELLSAILGKLKRK